MSIVAPKWAQGGSPDTPASGVLPQRQPQPFEVAPPAPVRPQATPTVGGRGATLSHYQHGVLASDAASAAAAAALAYGLALGTQLDWRYVALSLTLPVAWVLLVALTRGYERRFLGTDTEEYRRLMDAGLLLIAALAVGSVTFRGDLSRLYLFSAVPAAVEE